MLGIANPSQILACTFVAAGLVGLDRLIQKSGLLRLYAGNLAGGADSQGDEDCQHQEERLRHPVGQENSDKQASQVSSPRAVVPLAWSRGCAKMYPTPRTVLMWSLPMSESPSFLRTLLTCMSILRSNGENLRLSTASTRCSRVTTRPASRSKTWSKLNSTEVNSMGLPFWRTIRVAGSSSISPTKTISGICPSPAFSPLLSPAWVRRRMARIRATSSRGLKGLGR